MQSKLPTTEQRCVCIICAFSQYSVLCCLTNSLTHRRPLTPTAVARAIGEKAKPATSHLRVARQCQAGTPLHTCSAMLRLGTHCTTSAASNAHTVFANCKNAYTGKTLLGNPLSENQTQLGNRALAWPQPRLTGASCLLFDEVASAHPNSDCYHQRHSISLA